MKGLAGRHWPFSSTEPQMSAGRGTEGRALMGCLLEAVCWLAFKQSLRTDLFGSLFLRFSGWTNVRTPF